MRAVLVWLLLAIGTCCVPAAEPWPDFRGPAGSGHGGCEPVPLTWSDTQNIAWKTPILGRGWSSPVIWDEQVWLSTATSDGHELYAIGLDARTGRILHEVKVFDVEQPESIDPANSYASPSPVIDESHVYVHFGTYGTACLETATGAVLWTRRDLPVDHQKGPGSSPVLCGQLLIFQCDGNDVQYLIALDKRTGRTVWKTDRSVDLSRRAPDYRKSFSTPLVVSSAGRNEVISTAAGAVYAYDVHGGRELWRVQYPGHTNIARPVAGGGMLVINTGYPRPELWGLRPAGQGDVTATHVAWKVTRSVAHRSSPLLVEGLVYMVADNGVITCLELMSGDTVWQQRLSGNYSASPLLVRDRIYFFGENGRTTVLRPGREYVELAVNRLEEGCLASAAVFDSALFLRTTDHLLRIEAP